MPAWTNGSICARAQNDTPSATAAARRHILRRQKPRQAVGMVLKQDRNVRNELAQREHVACEVEAMHVHDVGRELA